MDYQHYIARKRVRLEGIGGAVNIPYGTKIEVMGNLLVFRGKAICFTTSQSAYDYFSQNDDGNGLVRGKLVQAIMDTLGKRDKQHQERWNRVWDDPACQPFKQEEHEDYWLWNHDFYNADLADLRHIAKLVGVKEVF